MMGYLVNILGNSVWVQSASSQVVFVMRRLSAAFAGGPPMDNWERRV